MKLKITYTPVRLFKRPFPPRSPAKHIKALLLRRHGSVKPNVASIPEGEETEGANLDKSFGFSKQFAKFSPGQSFYPRIFRIPAIEPISSNIGIRA
ncbi:hypothetical protein KY285_030259 [Solanum tuberosum]|nr:hypothetical protein KY285_030259 [Solanum tuberosum]